jgi:hypothetical protein
MFPDSAAWHSVQQFRKGVRKRVLCVLAAMLHRNQLERQTFCFSTHFPVDFACGGDGLQHLPVPREVVQAWECVTL